MRVRLPLFTFAAGFLLCLPSASGAQIQIKAGAAELRFSGNIQFQLATTTCTEAIPSPSSACSLEEERLNFFVRRARVSVETTIGDRLTLKLEPDFRDLDEIELKDAWARYTFGPRMSIKAGQFKRPFDGFELTSASVIPFEPFASIRGISGAIPGIAKAVLPTHSGLARSFDLSERELGIMFEGSTLDDMFGFQVGAFVGASESEFNVADAEEQFIGRANMSMEWGGMPLDFAAAIALTNTTFTAVDGEAASEYYTNFELWAELGGYDRRGLVVQAGLIMGDSPGLNSMGGAIDLAEGDDFASMRSWQAAAGFRMPTEGVEWLAAVAPVVRVSFGDPDTNFENDEAWVVTPGLGFYFYKRNRLTLWWDIASFATDGTDSENAFRAQLQFHY